MPRHVCGADKVRDLERPCECSALQPAYTAGRGVGFEEDGGPPAGGEL